MGELVAVSAGPLLQILAINWGRGKNISGPADPLIICCHEGAGCSVCWAKTAFKINENEML